MFVYLLFCWLLGCLAAWFHCWTDNNITLAFEDAQVIPQMIHMIQTMRMIHIILMIWMMQRIQN